MIRRSLALIAALTLTACASTEMRSFLGKPIEETQFAYGSPENVIEMQDGRRAYQYRWGGSGGVVPSRARTTAVTTGAITTTSTTMTPAMVFELAGCLITFIARDHGKGLVVEDYRVPKQLVC